VTANPTPLVPTARRAVVFAAIGEGVFTVMDMLIKSVATRIPTFEIAFLRFAFGLIWALLLVAILRPGWPNRETIVFNASRSVLVAITATSFFFALSKLPLADAIALSFLSPVFMALFGVLWLGERVDERIALALAAGFAGMLLIASGKFGGGDYAKWDAWLGVGACLVSAVTYAMAIVILRARAQRDPVPTILLFQNVGPALLLALPAASVWVAPTTSDLALFALIGAIGTGAHVLLALAFSRIEAARLAPIHYTTLVWGIVFGYGAFGDLPGAATLLGASLIVAGTLVAQHRRV
jgi:S-adenosylmethionine uptake transporter